MISVLKAVLVVVSLNAAQFVTSVYGADLRACASQISNPFYDLVSEKKVGGYIQCDYLRDNGDGSFSGNYCFYNLNYTITHYPNTPLRVDSSPDCPVTLPLASTYLIKTSTNLPGKCVTALSGSNGGAVTIQDCDYRHGNPGQRWTFQGSQIRMGNLCLDVTDGSTANGARLQVWTCYAGSANQGFTHSGGDVLDIPTDRIKWAAHTGKCMDLTGGSQANGNQIQMWDCGANNANQAWTIAVTR